jgi:hypothetical protein
VMNLVISPMSVIIIIVIDVVGATNVMNPGILLINVVIITDVTNVMNPDILPKSVICVDFNDY